MPTGCRLTKVDQLLDYATIVIMTQWSELGTHFSTTCIVLANESS